MLQRVAVERELINARRVRLADAAGQTATILFFIMGRKSKAKPEGEGNSLPEVLAPDPLPKAGDQVEYFWPETAEPELRKKNHGAKVLAVHEGYEGRLLDIEVDTGAGLLIVKNAPWRDADDNAGNTWHWPPQVETETE